MPNKVWLALVLLLVFQSAVAVLVNYTIDDKTGDQTLGRLPTYSPDGWWIQGEGQTCNGCTIGSGAGDPNNPGGPPFQNTWHENLNQEKDQTTSMTLSFEGSRIYVYGIIFAYSGANASIKVDGQFMSQNFLHTGESNPLSGPAYRYKVPMYVNESLGPGVHDVVFLNNPNSMMLFDYAIYSKEDNDTTNLTSPSPSDSTQTSVKKVDVGAIAGGAIAGVCVLAALLFLVVLLVRRRRQRIFALKPPRESQMVLRSPFIINDQPVVEHHVVVPSSQPSTQPFRNMRSKASLFSSVSPPPTIQHSDSGYRSQPHGGQTELPPSYTRD